MVVAHEDLTADQSKVKETGMSVIRGLDIFSSSWQTIDKHRNTWCGEKVLSEIGNSAIVVDSVEQNTREGGIAALGL
jgi:hypothetical protein